MYGILTTTHNSHAASSKPVQRLPAPAGLLLAALRVPDRAHCATLHSLPGIDPGGVAALASNWCELSFKKLQPRVRH